MELIEKVIPYKWADEFYIYPLGDMHLGVIHCDEDLLRAKVQEIKANDKALWLGMGDYADLITPKDFKRWDGALLADWMKGKEDNIGPTQVRKVNEILSPIWGQCIGLLEGNHDDNIRRFNHYNFMEELLLLANQKHSIPYAGVSCMARLIFRRENSKESHEYRIHARHGEGAARTSGARALAVLRLAMTFVDAHIVWSGHLHGQESPDIPQRLVTRGHKMKAFETVACMTGAWLKAYMQGVPPCYLERWGSVPSVLGCPHVILTPEQEKMQLVKTRVIKAI